MTNTFFQTAMYLMKKILLRRISRHLGIVKEKLVLMETLMEEWGVVEEIGMTGIEITIVRLMTTN